MPKHIIEFNLPEERDELKITMDAMSNSIKIDEIWEQCFRPFFKHGYKNQELNDLTEDPKVARAIELLADIYRDIVHGND